MSAATFEIITEFRAPVAAIIPKAVTPAQRDAIYRLIPDAAVMNLALAKRWNVWAVLCPPEWAQAQLRRQPMLKPKGQQMQLL